MPRLHWIGKEKVVNHHQDVPYKVLEHQYGFTANNGNQHTPTQSGNMIIKGDNLEALKALLPQYEGKVNCIYIDPPYNTGNEGWVYNDNVNSPTIKKWLGSVVGKEGEDLSRHDKWLCMMYPRLKLLHRLLANDGAIFISIDDNEQAHLKLICDEIFGGNNFVGTMAITRAEGGGLAKQMIRGHEYLNIYSKHIGSFEPLRKPKDIRGKIVEIEGEEYWIETDWLRKEFGKYGTCPYEEIIDYLGAEKKKEIDEGLQKGTYVLIKKEEFNIVGRYRKISEDGTKFYSLAKHLSKDGVLEVQDLFQRQMFDFPKPISLIKSLVSGATFSLKSKNSIILDSFAGSGTTAHAVMQLNKEDGGNRKFILVEMEDYAETITAERVKRVMQGVPESKNFKEGLGGAFDFYELGKPLFHSDGMLNEEVEEQKIRDYIWFTETRSTQLPELVPAQTNAEKHLLGVHEGCGLYFYYLPNEETILNLAFLSQIQTKAESYIIYADELLLTQDQLRQLNIVFKKIPRDITRL